MVRQQILVKVISTLLIISTCLGDEIVLKNYRKTDDLYYGKVFMTGICCIGILFIGILVISNVTILGDFDVCFDPNCG